MTAFPTLWYTRLWSEKRYPFRANPPRIGSNPSPRGPFTELVQNGQVTSSETAQGKLVGPKTKSKRAGKIRRAKVLLHVEYFPPVLTLSSGPLTAPWPSPRMIKSQVRVNFYGNENWGESGWSWFKVFVISLLSWLIMYTRLMKIKDMSSSLVWQCYW